MKLTKKSVNRLPHWQQLYYVPVHQAFQLFLMTNEIVLIDFAELIQFNERISNTNIEHTQHTILFSIWHIVFRRWIDR